MRLTALLFLVLSALSLVPARAQELQRFEFKQIVMAIEARIVLYAPDEATAKRAASSAFALLDAMDATFSDYRADSELMRLCDQAADVDVTASPGSTLLSNVLFCAQEIDRSSGGAFDISVGPLSRLWRTARAAGRLPAANDIEQARLHVGNWSIRPHASPIDGPLVHLARGTRFDVGGIAKGYAAGTAAWVCEDQGVPAVLVEIGGDLCAGGAPPGEDGWEVALGTELRQRVTVARACVSTSGDESQALQVDAVRYSHVIDPRTGWAISNGRRATVFIHEDIERGMRLNTAGAWADALATTACLIEPQAARLIAAGCNAVLEISDPAFTSLFDGTTLTGWTPRGGHYDGDAVWTVEDGCITGHAGADNAGGLLYTATPHTSFEFQCECKLDYPFDSGIFVRMAPEGRGMQLTLDDRPDGEVGGLYSDGWIEHAHPEAARAWRRGQWNHVFVRCTGFDMRIEAWINGVPVMDRIVPQEFGADGKPAYAPRGLIGLQVHGGGSEGTGNAVRFRNIEVRDLPVFGDAWATDHALSPPERETRDAARAKDGWRDLLGGADPLSAWEAVDGEDAPHAPTDYSVKDGVLSIPSSQPAGYLRTKADVRDFDLRFDFRQARMSNSGLFLRGRRESVGPDGARVSGGNPAYSGCEIQLLDDWNWETVTQSQLHDWQFTGSLYGAVPPCAKGLLRPIGEWNTLEVLARGSRLACALNGQTLWDVDTAHVAADPPFAQRAAAGFLGLQRYAAPAVQGAEAVGVREMWIDTR
ncbi:MAG TPA: family 16 glycoside hydrolase [Planctomycetota bacterium]|nr:family 16 glycoside hydrolase [Planctomycetota bacterium]